MGSGDLILCTFVAGSLISQASPQFCKHVPQAHVLEYCLIVVIALKDGVPLRRGRLSGLLS